MKALSLACTFLSLIPLTQSYEGFARTWVTSSFIANGSGCLLGQETNVAVQEDTLEIILNAMGIELPANSGLPFAQRKFCGISLGIESVPHHFPTKFIQRLAFGARKSANTSAVIVAQTSIGELALPPLELDLPDGLALNEGEKQIEVEYQLSPEIIEPDEWCLAPLQSGLFSSRIVVQGMRASDLDELIIASGRAENALKFSAEVQWTQCPEQNDEPTNETAQLLSQQKSLK